MHPYISLGPGVLLDSWRVMMVTAVTAGSLTALWALRGEAGWLRGLLLTGALAAGAFLGARLAHLVFFWEHNRTQPFPLLSLWDGGHSFVGAPVLGALLLAGLTRLLGVRFWVCADAFALGTPVGLFFARIGCYLKGCCWGTPIGEGHPLHGISFKLIDNQVTALHPVQLYSAGAALALFLSLLWIRRQGPAPGVVAGVLVLLYASARFVLEFFRADTAGHTVLGGPLTVHQAYCLIAFPLAAVFLLVRRRGRGERTA